VKSSKNSECANTKEAFGSSSFRDILKASISWFLALPLSYAAVNECDGQSVVALQAASSNKANCVRDHIHSSWLKFKGRGIYPHCCPVPSQRRDSGTVVNGVDGLDKGPLPFKTYKLGALKTFAGRSAPERGHQQSLFGSGFRPTESVCSRIR
jgi:hypothetical protein